MTIHDSQGAEEAAEYIEAVMAHEQSPLLPDSTEGHGFAKKKYQFGFFLIFSFVLIVGAGIAQIPNLEVLRYIICQKYYAESGNHETINLVARFDGGVDSRCSVDPISRSLAQFTGLMDFVESFVALLVVLPYGKMADLYGRKPPIMIAVVGVLLFWIWTLIVVLHASVWSINMILFGSIISGLTGASPVFRMILYTMICDMFGEADRLVALSIFLAVLLVGGSLAPAIGSSLLSVGLLWPLYIGTITIGVGLLILLFLPETHAGPAGKGLQSICRGDSQVLNDEDLHTEQEAASKSIWLTCYNALLGSLAALQILGRGGNFIAVAIVAFVNGISGPSRNIIPQFLNHGLKWSMVKIGYLIAGMCACRVFILLVILPLFTKLMLRRMPSRRLDVLTIKLSVVADMLVNLAYGLMTSATPLFFIVPVSALGAPLTASIKVVISNLVEAHEIGQVFAAFSVVEGLSDMIGGPVCAIIYSSTLALHPGSVFLVLAGLFATALVAASFIRTERFVQ